MDEFVHRPPPDGPRAFSFVEPPWTALPPSPFTPIPLGFVLAANSLCRGQENYTKCAPRVQIGNCI